MAGSEIQQTLQTLTWPAAFVVAIIVVAIVVIIRAYLRALR